MRPLSARNPRVQRLARLARRREERDLQRAFVVEGPALVRAALDAGAPVREVFVDQDALGRPAVADLLAVLPAATDVWSVPAKLLDRVGDAVTSQGAVAVVDRVDAPWPSPDRTSFVVVLVEVSDPGNVGTLIRTAAAAGAGAVVVVGGADPTGPKVVRSSAGAVFGVDVVAGADPDEALHHLTSAGYRTLATDVHRGDAYDAVDLRGPVAVLLGNEARGLDPDLADRVHGRITIPMAGPTESLNVAMAGTVVCFEVLRQRRTR